MKHDAIELLARMAHVHAAGEAGERIPWALLTAEQRDARIHEAVSMLSGLGRTSYPTNPEGLTVPADIAAAAESVEGRAAAGRLGRITENRALVIGVDRMDYSKGLPQRMEAHVTAARARAPCERPGRMPASSESTSASQLASMMFSETPIEPQVSWPSVASSRTRVTAPVPWWASMILTL